HRRVAGRVISDGRPQLGRFSRYRKLKPGGHHADDREVEIIESDVSSDHSRIGVEAVAPQAVADDHDERVRFVLFRAKASSQTRRDAEQREQIRRDYRSVQAHWLIAARKREVALTESRQPLKTFALCAPVHKVRIRNAAVAIASADIY